MATTDKMNLILPTVSSTLGPEWATMLNTLLELVDEHDHSSGKGNLVTPAGMSINAVLDFVNNAIKNAASVQMQDKSVADTTTNGLGSIQRIGGNLWWVTPAGASVQITSGSSIISTGSGVFSVSAPSSWPHSVVVGDAQSVLIADSTTAARTFNLPAATNAMTVTFKDGDGNAQTNNISIAPNGTDLIEGVNATFTMEENWGSRTLISDGVSKWYII